MVVSTIAERTFEKIFLDIVGPIDLLCEGNLYILTIQDDLPKYSMAVPIPDHTARTVPQAFIEHSDCLHVIPNSIVTEQGREFMGNVFSACCKLLKIKKNITTTYYYQPNSALERSHRTLIETLYTIQNNKTGISTSLCSFITVQSIRLRVSNHINSYMDILLKYSIH